MPYPITRRWNFPGLLDRVLALGIDYPTMRYIININISRKANYHLLSLHPDIFMLQITNRDESCIKFSSPLNYYIFSTIVQRGETGDGRRETGDGRRETGKGDR